MIERQIDNPCLAARLRRVEGLEDLAGSRWGVPAPSPAPRLAPPFSAFRELISDSRMPARMKAGC